MEPQSSQLIRNDAHATPLPHRRLKVLFDGRKIGDGGIGVYIDSTITGLLSQGGSEITVISSKERASSVAWRERVRWIYDATKPYSLSEYLLLARRIDFSLFDLFHSPHYTLPFGIPLPTVVTVHDLIHIERPERFFYPFVAKWLIRSAVRRAHAVIAVSMDTEQALMRHGLSTADKVEVIPNAAPSFEDDSREEATIHQEENGPYFVAVLSNVKPHKGVGDLITAYSAARERAVRESNAGALTFPRLLLVGYGAEHLRSHTELSKQLTRAEGIRLVGAVNRTVLRSLYAGSLGVVVPSLAEGFCLPALEAQSVGARVVCRPVAVLGEIVTSRDIVARDFSVGALEAALLEAFLRPCLDRSIDSQHLARFSRENVTRQLLSVYERVVPQLAEAEVFKSLTHTTLTRGAAA